MPIYSVQAPDGYIYDIEGPDNATDKQLIAVAQREIRQKKFEEVKAPKPQIPEPPTEQGGFFSSLKQGASTLGELPAALRFGTASPEEAAARREALVKAGESPNATTSFSDIKDVGSAIDWAKQTAGGSLGSVVAPAAGALGAGLMKGPGAAKVVGSGLLGLQYLTENLGRQAGEQTEAIKENKEYTPTSLTKAGVGAAGQTALDIVGFKFLSPVLKSFPVVGKLFGEAGEKASVATADQLVDAFKKGTITYTNGVAKGIGLGVVVEVPQEIAQSALERWQAGLSLTDANARKEYLEAAAGAVLLGGGIGGMGAALDTRAKKAEAASIIEAQEEVKKREAESAKTAAAPAVEKPAVPAKESAAAPAAGELLQDFVSGDLEAAPAGAIPTDEFAADNVNEGLGGAPTDEKEKIMDSLANTGSTEETARLLGISRDMVKKVQQDNNIPSKATPEGRAAFTTWSAQRKAQTAADAAAKVAKAQQTPVVETPVVETPAALEGELTFTKPETPDTPYLPEATLQTKDATYSATGTSQSVSFGTPRPTKGSIAVNAVTAKFDEKAGQTVIINASSPQSGPIRVSVDSNYIELDAPNTGNYVRLSRDDRKNETVVRKAVGDDAVDVFLSGGENTVGRTATAFIGEDLSPKFNYIASKFEKNYAAASAATTVTQNVDKLKAEAEAKLKAEQEKASAATTGAVGTETGAGSVGASIRAKAPARAATDVASGVGVGGAGTTVGKSDVGTEDKQPSLNKKQNHMLRLQKVRDGVNGIKEKIAASGLEGSVDTLRKLSILLDDTFEAIDELAPKNKRITNTTTNKVKELETRLEELNKPPKKQEHFITKERKSLEAQETKSQQRATEESKREREAEESALGKGAKHPELAKAILSGDINAAISHILKSGRGVDSRKLGSEIKTKAWSFLTPYAKNRIETSKVIFRAVAESLSGVDFSKSKVVFTEVDDPTTFKRLKKENKLAEYDPKTDTFYFTRDGIDEATILHEAVHAATIKILRQFEIDPSKLTQEQRDAAEHLNKIYALAKKKLGGKYKSAFENVYEFISYSLTDPRFQSDLATLRSPTLAKYTKAVKDLWSQLTEALMNMFGVTTPKGTKLEIRPEYYKDLMRGYGGELYVPDTVTKKMLSDLDKDDTSSAYLSSYANLAALKEATSSLAEEYPEAYTDTGDEITDLRVFASEALGNKALQKDISRITQEGLKAKRGLAYEQGYEGNLLLETSEIFKLILSTPEAGVDLAPLAATKQAEPTVSKPTSAYMAELNKKMDEKFDKPKGVVAATKFLMTDSGYDWLVHKFQNDRVVVKKLENGLRMAGKLIVGEKGFNNLYSLITNSSGNAFHLVTQYVQSHVEDAQNAIYAYAKTNKIDVKEALNKLHLYLMAQHEPERRRVKYLRNAPLSNTPVRVKGQTRAIGAADLREMIYNNLDKNKNLSESEAKKYRTTVEYLVKNFVDPNGYTPSPNVDVKGVRKSKSTDLNSDEYRVIGEYPQEDIVRMRGEFEAELKSRENGPSLRKLIAAMKDLNENTIELDRQANYWTKFVDNYKSFYGYEHYVPFKGRPQVSDNDDKFEYNSKGRSGELVQSVTGFEGRESDSDNPILQTFADAATSAMRAGRLGVTEAIKNLMGFDEKGDRKNPQYIKGDRVAIVKFEDRENALKENPALKSPNNIFHYMPDGTIEVYSIKDNAMLEGIRRSFKTSQPFIQFVNQWTSFVGKGHTRFNPSFAPMNFVRDALTNAFTIGAEMGPKAAYQFISTISDMVARGGMKKAWIVASLYEKGGKDNIAKIQKMGESDPFIRDILEYLETGGRVSYVQGLAVKSQMDELLKDVGRSKLIRSTEQVTKYIDIWTDMFELTSRAAAYSVAKSNAEARGMTKAAAKIEATAYAKNLANFEQVGEWGRAAGAAFMFFRPAATGAVRALDALMPWFQDTEMTLNRQPPAIKDDPKAAAEFRKNHKERKKNAKYMAMGLAGAGATIYLMALMMAGDDELGRNRIATDDMSRWTRYLRLPIPGSDQFLQIPWGFGLGAFAAAGAQIAGAAFGKTSLADMGGNLAQVALDSYIPLPISRMNPTDNFAAWAIDSITPSLVRPFVEYVMNVDSLGREIYNNRQTRFGDAYTGGDNIPEIYKSAARNLANFTNGGVDWSANTMYFFLNNYVDGQSRILQNGFNLGLLVAGDKQFDAKHDLILVDSFMGKKSNFDAREFAAVENQIKDKEKRLKMFAADPEQYAKYIEAYPLDLAIVDIYNKQVNGTLNKVRAQLNVIRRSPDYSPKERKELIEDLTSVQNLIKRGMIDTFEAYDIKP